MSAKAASILLVRIPEVNFDDEHQPVEQQSRAQVLVPAAILHLGSYVKATMPVVRVEYSDLHLQLHRALRGPTRTCSQRDLLREEIRKTCNAVLPDIVGLSCNMNLYAETFHLCASLFREAVSGALLVAGGHYPSSFPGKVAADLNIDYVVVGEGELPFTRFIDDYGKGRLPDHSTIDTREYLSDLTAFPPLDYQGLHLENYLGPGLGMMDEARNVTLVTSRGCPMRCIYCATHNVWDYGFRTRTPEQMLEEIRYLKEAYDVNSFIFVEDNFALDKRRVKRFCNLLLEEKMNVRWYASSVYVNALDEEVIDLMVESGCVKFNLAIESGTQHIQKLIRKHVRLDHAQRIGECIARSGVVFECLLIFGFPGETIDEMQETIRFAKSLKCDWYQMNIATPLYGTEMYDMCSANNWLASNEAVTKTFRTGAVSTPNFSKEQVEDLMWDANYRLNFLENKSYEAGDYDKALSYFERVAVRYPKHFMCRYMLWQIYQKQGRAHESNRVVKEMRQIRDANREIVDGLIERYDLKTGSVWSVDTGVGVATDK